MRKISGSLLLVLLALMVAVTACSTPAGAATVASPTPAAMGTPTTQTFTDPFSYCAAAGTVDVPDARYTGPKITDQIVQGYLKAAGLTGSSEPADVLNKTTSWRCMDGKVYACNVGANLPCDFKADTVKTPTQAMTDYCAQNQDSDFIPMSVTGHATIYSWHCVKGAAEVLEQTGQVDAAGYLSNIWYPIEPQP